MIQWIVLIHFVLASAIAQGTMPVQQAGAMAVVICTGNGPVTLLLGPDGQPVEESDERCDWATHGQGLAVPKGPSVFAAAEWCRISADPTAQPACIGHSDTRQNVIRPPPLLL